LQQTEKIVVLASHVNVVEKSIANVDDDFGYKQNTKKNK
jgi:hypothetical protein